MSSGEEILGLWRIVILTSLLIGLILLCRFIIMEHYRIKNQKKFIKDMNEYDKKVAKKLGEAK